MKFRSLLIHLSGAIIIVMLISALIISCNNDKKDVKSIEADKEKLMEINKAMVNEEQEQIADYIKRYSYNMEETKTGLHIMHVEEGKGVSARPEMTVSLKYRISFLDGSYCYSSDSSGILTFQLGQSTEPSGLQEGLLHMKQGGKAIMIVPSYLAYGMTGDGDKITSNQSLVYSVELVEVK